MPQGGGNIRVTGPMQNKKRIKKNRGRGETASAPYVFSLKPLAAGIRTAGLSVAGLALSLNAGTVIAGPTGGQVAAGTGTISRPDVNTTVIQQGSQNLILNWETFNVAPKELVQFNQPNTSAAALNKIFDQNPSEIYGSIRANGRVALINPNGVLFKPGASVSVGSLIASGLDIKNEDFMAGEYKFSAPDGQEGGTVINHGTIAAATGGSVSLIGGAVRNEGVIYARAGSVNLAAGRQVTMDFDGDGLIQFAVDGEVMSNAQGLSDAVSNTGEIIADGSSVLLAGKAAADVFTNVVNNEGIIKAGRIENHGGVVRLVAEGAGSTTINTGTIDASSNDGSGGTVHVLGDRVGLFGNSSIDVSGTTGGGEVLVGGDYQGKNPEILNASQTIVGQNAVINADAVTSGDGGKVILWSDDATQFHGTITAKGGVESGDGGFVEVSSKEKLVFEGKVDTSAINGDTGSVLLDPRNLEIIDTGSTTDLIGTPDDGNNQIYAFTEDPSTDITGATGLTSGTVETLLDSNNVTLQANNDITVTDDIDASTNAGDFGLTLEAGRSILINNNIKLRGSFTATANTSNAAVVETQRTASTAGVFTMGDTWTISTINGAAPGNITINMSTGDPAGTGFNSGDITISNLNAGTAHVLISQAGQTNGSDILRTAASTITAASAALDISNAANTTGTVGVSGTAINTNVANIEIRTRGGSAYINENDALIIGGANLGSLNGVNVGTGTFSLTAGGAVTDSGVVADTIIAGGMAVTGAGATLDLANNVTTLAASMTGAGNAFTFTNEADGFTVGTVDGVVGITTATSASTTATGSVTLSTTGGDIAITNNITTGAASTADGTNATSGGISITAGTNGNISGVATVITGNATVSAGGTADTSATGGITLSGNEVSKDGSTALAVHVGAATGATTSNTPGKLAAATDGVGALGEIRITSDSNLTLGVLDTANPSAATVDITLTTDDNLLTVGAVSDLDADAVNLIADKMAIGFGISTTATMTLTSKNASDAINLGSAVDTTANTLELSNTEIGNITAGTLVIGGSTGTLTISAALTTPTITNVTLIADKMALGNTLNATGGIVTLRSQTAANTIVLGSATDVAANTLELSGTELDNVTANILRIGNAAAGNLSVSAAIAPSGTTTLSLVTGGTVTQTNTITETNLAIQSAGAVTLNGTNDVDNLAANVSGATNTFQFTDIDDVTIPATAIDGVTGLTTNNGAITLTIGTTTDDAALTVNGAVASGGAAINLFGDHMALTTTVNAGAGTVTLAPESTADTGDAINLGGADGTDTLGLTSTELNNVTAGILRIGNASAGNISVSAAIAPSGTSTLSLVTGGTVTQTNTITETNLAIQSAGAVTLNGANDAGNLAANVSGATNAFQFTDINAVTIPATAIDGVTGMTTNNGAITLSIGTITDNAALTINGAVASGGAAINLFADNMTLAASVNAGANIATLAPLTSAGDINDAVDLGGVDAADVLGLTDTELDFVTATTLIVGSTSASGAITISSNISPGSVTNLHLFNGANIITDSATITVSGLAITSGGAVTLNNANAIDTLAASLTTAGSGFTFTGESSGFSVGAVDGVTGIATANGVASSSGSITLSTASGGIVIDENVTTGTASIADAGGNQTPSSGDISVAAATSVTGDSRLITGNADLTGAGNTGTDSATSGSITVVGGSGGASGGIGLSSANAMTIGTATRTGSSTDTATSGNISLTSRDEINNGTASTPLDVSIGSASGASVNNQGTLAVTTSQAAGNIFITSGEALILALLDTQNAATQTVNISVTGDNTLLTFGTASNLDADNVTLTADDMDITATLTMTSGRIIVKPNQSTDTINLGSLSSAADNILQLSSAELDRFVTATGVLEIGSSASGAITVSADVTTGANDTNGALHLKTGGSVTATAGGIVETNLGITAGGTVNFTDSTTAVTTLAISNAGNSVSFTEADGFSVGTVDGVAGISGSTVTLNVTNGALVVTNTGAANDIDATGLITLNLPGNDTGFTINTSADVVTTSGGVTVIADNMTLTGTIHAGTGLVTLRPDDNNPIEVGTGAANGTGGGAKLGITNTELQNIFTSGGLTIGSTSHSDIITIVGAVTSTNTAGITGGTISLLNLDNDIIVNAAFNSNGRDMTLSSSDSAAGDGNIVFGATGALTATGAIVTLNVADGSIQGNAASLTNITAATVSLTATKGIGLSDASALELAAQSVSATTTATGIASNSNTIFIDNNSASTTTVTGLATLNSNGTNTAIKFDQTGGGDLSITGNVTTGNGTTIDGASIIFTSSAGLTQQVSSTISTKSGSGGTLNVINATQSGTIQLGPGNITLQGSSIDSIITSDLIFGDSPINITASRDIIISALVQTTETVEGTPNDVDITLIADSNNDGDGGVWIKGTGKVDSADNVIIQGADINDITAIAGAAIQVDVDNVSVTADQILSAGTIILQRSTCGLCGTSTDIVVNGRLTSGGNVTITSYRDVLMGVDGDVLSNGGDVLITADDAVGNNGGVITMADGTVIDSGAGTITLNADGSVTLGNLTSISGSTPAVTVTSTSGAIVDGGDTDIDISAGVVTLSAATGIGNANAIDTTIGTINAVNSGSNAIQINETNDLALDTVDNGTRSVTLTTGGSVTDGGDVNVDIVAGSVVINAAGDVGTVTTFLTGAGSAIETTVTTNITVATTNGDINLDIGSSALSGTIDLTPGGTNDAIIQNAAGNLNIGSVTTSFTTTAGDNIGFIASGILTIPDTGLGVGATANLLLKGNDVKDVSGYDLGSLVANTLYVISNSATDTTLNTTVSSLHADFSSSTVALLTVMETNDLALDTVANGTRAVSITSGGAITDGGDGNVDIVAGTTTLSTATGIGAVGTKSGGAADDAIEMTVTTLNAVNSTSGEVQLDETNDVALDTVNNATRAVSLTAGGAITDGGDGNVDIVAGTTTLSAVSGIGSGNALETTITSINATNSTSNGIELNETNDLALDTVANGTRAVSITSGGAITDGGDGNVDIVAGTTTLTATAGIGTFADSIDTNITNLMASAAGAGGIFINEANALTLSGGLSTAGGDIQIMANGTFNDGGNTIETQGTGAGGSVTIATFATNTNDITLTGIINTSGANGAPDNPGSDAGGVIVHAGQAINASTATIIAKGGNAGADTNGIDFTGLNGGFGAPAVTITAANGAVSIGAVDTSGGNATGFDALNPGSGGSAGDIPITSNNSGNVTLNGLLIARGGNDSSGGGTGTNKTVTINSAGNVVDNNDPALDINAGTLNITSAGDIGTITTFASGTGNAVEVIITGSITAVTTNGDINFDIGNSIPTGIIALTPGGTNDAIIQNSAGALNVGSVTTSFTSTVGDGFGFIALSTLTIPDAGYSVGTSANLLLKGTDVKDVSGYVLGPLTANDLTIVSSTANNTTLNTTIGSLTADFSGATSGVSLTVNETNSLTLTNIDTNNGNFSVTSSGSITVVDIDTAASAAASTATVTLNTGGIGAIIDGGDAVTDGITAQTISLTAATGIANGVGVDDRLELDATNLRATTVSGNIDIEDTTGGLTIIAPGVIISGVTSSNSNIDLLVTGGSLTVTSIIRNAQEGDVSLAATGINSDILIGNAVTQGYIRTSAASGTSSNISLTADDSILFGTTSYIYDESGVSNATVNITLIANNDASGPGDTGSIIDMTANCTAGNCWGVFGNLVTFDGPGLISLTTAGPNGGNIILSQVYGSSAATNAVTINSAGAVIDGGDTNSAGGVGTENIIAPNGGVVITAASGIGDAADPDAVDAAIETNVASIDAVNSTSGTVQISETDSIAVVQVMNSTRNITIKSLGAITNATATDNTADIVGAIINLNAGTGIGTGGNGALDITATTSVSAVTTTGNVDIDSLATADLSVTGLTTSGGSINFDQTGNVALNISNGANASGSITITNTGDNATADVLTIGNAISSSGAGTITISTLTRGNIAVNNNITTASGGTINISSSDNLTIQAGATSISSGAGGSISLRVDNNNNVAATLNLGGGTLNASTINMLGGANTTLAVRDTLIAQNATNSWLITDDNDGTLNSPMITTAPTAIFNDFHYLIGGTSTDSFTFTNNKTIAGSIDGKAGHDTISFSPYTSAVDIILTAADATDGFTGNIQVSGGGLNIVPLFNNIDQVNGNNLALANAADLFGLNTVSTWNVDGVLNTYTDTVSGHTLNFSATSWSLNGGTAVDTFTLTASHTGNLNGGNGNNIFNLQSTTNAVLTGNITGGTGNDTITFGTSNPTPPVGSTDNFRIVGSVDGGTGSDILDISGSTLILVTAITGPGTLDGQQGSILDSDNPHVNIAPDFDLISGTFDNINTVNGNGTSFQGPNTDTFWNITGSNSGTYGGPTLADIGDDTFTNFSIVGGSANDVFVFQSTGKLSYGLNGGGGTNTLAGSLGDDQFNISGAKAGSITVDRLGAALVTNFTNIDSIDGAQATDDGTTTVGDTGNDVFVLLSSWTGSLKGSGGDDAFVVILPGITFGSIEGGTGNDALVAVSGTNTWVVNGAGAGANGSSGTFNGSGYIEMQALVGGTGIDTFNIQALDNALTINGGDGNDVFNVSSDAPTNAGNVNAIAATLTLNGENNSDTINLSDAGDATNNTGTITSTTISGLGLGSPITYGTMEAININLGSGNDNFTITSPTAVTTVSGNVGTDTFTIVSNSAALTVNGGANNDTINVQGTGSTVTVNSGDGNDSVNLGNGGNSLDNITAGLTVNGDAHTTGDILTINDQGDNSGNTYTITGTTITRNGISMTYGTFEQMDLNTGSGNDTINDSGWASTTANIVDAGGSDIFNTTGNFSITGDFTITNIETLADGTSGLGGNGIGADTLTITNASSGVDFTTAINDLVITGSGNTRIDELNGIELTTVNVGANNFTLNTLGGSILDTAGTTLVAKDLSLTAGGAGSAVGTSSNYILTNLSGTLTANAPNGAGDIFIHETAGSITVAGINAGLGNINLVANTSIGETGPISGNLLTVTAGATITLNSTNTVKAFTATSNGNISLTNTAAPLDLQSVSTGGNNLTINNTGSVGVTGTVNTGAGDTSITSSVNIINGGGTITTNNLTLNAGNGIGTVGPAMATTTTGNFNLTTAGAGAAGNINLAETNNFNTSQLNLNTADPSDQIVIMSSNGGAGTITVNDPTGGTSNLDAFDTLILHGIIALNNDVTTGGTSLVFGGVTTFSGNRSVNAGTGILTFVGPVNGGIDLTLTASEVDALSNIIINGALNITGVTDISGRISVGSASFSTDVNVNGVVLSTGNVTTGGTTTFNDNVNVGGNLTTGGDTSIAGNTNVTGNITNNSGGFTSIDGTVKSGGDITTAGVTTFNSTVDATGNLTTGGDTTIGGDTNVGSNITTGGNTTIAGVTTAGGNITNNSGGLTQIDGTVSAGNMTTAGVTTLGSTLDLTGNLVTGGDTTIAGDTSVGGNITNNSGGFTQIDGAVSAGNMTTAGITSIGSSLDLTGSLSTGGATTVLGITNVAGSINNTAGGASFQDAVTAGTSITTGGPTSFCCTVMAGNNITTGGDTSLGGDVDGADLVFGGSTLSIDSDTILRSTTDSINFPASVVGTGALAIDPTDGQDMVISNSGGGTTGIIEANVFTGFQGHLIIGGTTTPLSSTPLLADSFDVSAAFIDVQVPLVSSGPITLLAGGINLAAGTPDNSIDGTVDLISAGGPGGSPVSLIAVGQSFTATQNSPNATGDITTNGDVTIAGGEALFVAQGSINDSSQINLQLAQGPVFVATGTGSSTAVQFNPASSASSGDTAQVEDLIGRLTAASIGGNTFSVQAQFVLLVNPAQALLGLEAVGFIDVSLFEEELSLFGVIGQGIALALAQCEEVEGCAPNVTEEELNQLIGGLEARITELERRLANDKLSDSERSRMEKVLAGYRDELENFQTYKTQLQQYSSGSSGDEEDFGDDFGGGDEGATPETGPAQDISTQVNRLNGIAGSMRTRISWLEGLKTNAEERARLSQSTGIDLTVEKLDAIIEATQKALQSIENEIKLLQEGTQAALPDEQPFFSAQAGDPVALNVQYGPALLHIDDGSLNTDTRWY